MIEHSIVLVEGTRPIAGVEAYAAGNFIAECSWADNARGVTNWDGDSDFCPFCGTVLSVGPIVLVNEI